MSLGGKRGLVEWFLSQQDPVNGFTRAIYTGLPTVEFARVIKEYVLPNPSLSGIYNVSSEPVSKYVLLKLIVDQYKKKIQINPFGDLCIDRSLDSTLFCNATSYRLPSWEELVEKMYQNYISMKSYYAE